MLYDFRWLHTGIIDSSFALFLLHSPRSIHALPAHFCLIGQNQALTARKVDDRVKAPKKMSKYIMF